MDQKPMEIAKRAAGIKAAEFIEPHMTVGLGTGSTTKYFIEALAERFKNGLSFRCAATSTASESLAKSLGLPLVPIASVSYFDIDVDGADLIDDEKNMIKGGGGALLREKIIAGSSREMIVLIDSTKRKKHLGGSFLPVEILPFGSNLTINKIESMNLRGAIRLREGRVYTTDNGNFIYDIQLEDQLSDPWGLELSLLNIPGVIETGLFLGYAGRVIMGEENGSVHIY
ncbi:ribose 5-phosphate isomerase A [Estrella lausannensis]|uniref:Ribose-5-phosphate isomerase A n=1 Tax=Estrella lausannensis TaxID=483423 RepID=A0A0H5DPF7_9BACT|nr:ribose 5-phosphate isomerase A [Estrella lausannensis]CRX38441.1 Ribose 5-phosphate isomerase [Estrella lausannensis]